MELGRIAETDGPGAADALVANHARLVEAEAAEFALAAQLPGQPHRPGPAAPEAAQARRVAAALERFVVTGQCNEYGLKTVAAKAAAGDAVFFVAMCDRIAQILLLEGDSDPVGARRSKALGMLANPAGRWHC